MTKTCPHCHATVLSTSQPNLMGTTPELQKMYELFGGEPVAYRWRQPGNKLWIYDPTPEWIEDHRHEIELEPLYAALAATPAVGGLADKIEGHVSTLANTGMNLSLIEWDAISNDLLSAAKALRATPSVGGEAIKRVAAALNVVLLEYDYDFDDSFLNLLATRAIEAAPPASPLRGRDSVLLKWQEKLADLKNMKARGDLTPQWGESSLISAQTIVDDLTASASPPEQPAAVPLAVRLRDEAGPTLPQMIAQRRAQLSEQPAAVKMYRDALAAANARIAELEDRLSKAAFTQSQ